LLFAFRHAPWEKICEQFFIFLIHVSVPLYT
jgi:hypothetical protein